MTLPNSIHSIGQSAQLLQVMPGRINEVAERLGIVPALHINGISHYAEADLQRIADHLRTPTTTGRATDGPGAA